MGTVKGNGMPKKLERGRGEGEREVGEQSRADKLGNEVVQRSCPAKYTREVGEQSREEQSGSKVGKRSRGAK